MQLIKHMPAFHAFCNRLIIVLFLVVPNSCFHQQSKIKYVAIVALKIESLECSKILLALCTDSTLHKPNYYFTQCFRKSLQFV